GGARATAAGGRGGGGGRAGAPPYSSGISRPSSPAWPRAGHNSAGNVPASSDDTTLSCTCSSTKRRHTWRNASWSSSSSHAVIDSRHPSIRFSTDRSVESGYGRVGVTRGSTREGWRDGEYRSSRGTTGQGAGHRSRGLQP